MAPTSGSKPLVPTQPGEKEEGKEGPSKKRKLEDAEKEKPPEKKTKLDQMLSNIGNFSKRFKEKKKMAELKKSHIPQETLNKHYAELFEKRKKMANAIISGKPAKTFKRKSVTVTNIAPFPSVLEVSSFIRQAMKVHGIYLGDQVEEIIVPQVDYFGTPKHQGYAKIIVKDVGYVQNVLDSFKGKVFAERLVQATMDS